MAMSTAGIIWNGINIIEKNKPIASPEATVSRHGTHNARLNSGLESFLHHGRWRSFGCLKAL